ncbi:MAG: imidazolonepropionase [Candidatus Heimdallarchaeota archaeon]|nr:imidazolonepropionase [Candidatus Heimdallarchaeota archaeon]
MDIVIRGLHALFTGKELLEGPLSVRIENGILQEIVNDDTLSGGDKVINAEGKVATVPFHDAHTHIIFAGTRFFELDLKLKGKTYSEILAQGGGIKKTMTETRKADDETLRQLLVKRLDTMLTHGSIMVEAKSGYGLSTEEELRQLRIINEVNNSHPIDLIATFGGAHVPPPGYDRKQYVDDILDEMIPTIAKEKLATTTDVFCDRGAFTVEETRLIFERSLEYKIPVRVHAEELEYTGIGKIAATEYAALSADHLLKAKTDDFKVLAESGTVANFMPLAPIGLFTNDIPRGWQHTDVTIGIGSDFNPNNWIVSMQTAIRMAVFRYGMTPLRAMEAATSGSHKAITGTELKPLQEGERAAIAVLNASSIEEFTAKIGQNLLSELILDDKIWVSNQHSTV